MNTFYKSTALMKRQRVGRESKLMLPKRKELGKLNMMCSYEKSWGY